MKLPFFPTALLAGFVTVVFSGCAFLTQGQKQTVVVRSTPSGAKASINGTVVGTTPFKVKLARDEVFRVDVEKNGFVSESAVLLPSSYNYDQRFLRWGIDYDLGAATDLVPGELVLEMKPALGESTGGDAYSEMTAQIVRADAMLASGELSQDDYKYLVDRIIATYHRN
jgi:PEGA domain.